MGRQEEDHGVISAGLEGHKLQGQQQQQHKQSFGGAQFVDSRQLQSQVTVTGQSQDTSKESQARL